MSNRYIYHYNAVSAGGNMSYSGIAQLEFRIKSQEDLEKLKDLISDKGFKAPAIVSLSFLGMEIENGE